MKTVTWDIITPSFIRAIDGSFPYVSYKDRECIAWGEEYSKYRSAEELIKDKYADSKLVKDGWYFFLEDAMPGYMMIIEGSPSISMRIIVIICVDILYFLNYCACNESDSAIDFLFKAAAIIIYFISSN